jgi:HK97 family phage major capsid protein
MSDMSELTTLIEASNKAFEEFKTENNKQLDLLKKGQPVPEDLTAKMAAIQKDFADQKTAIETLEAKMKRPHMGADGKVVDEAAEGHRAKFKNYLVKGQQFDQESLQYQEGVSVKALGISSGPDGGFAVPKVIDGIIDATVLNISPIREIARVQQVSTPDFHKLVNIHGTDSGWVGETAARPATTTPSLKDIAPPMGELYANPQATQQMLDDVFFNAEQWLAEEVALRFAVAEGAAFVTGTGVEQPRGFATYTTVATADATRAWGSLEYIATGASGAFKTLTSTVNPADDLFTLVSKLKKGYRNGSRWVMNKTTLFAIMGFKDYQGRYVFSPVTSPGMEDTILGYPIVEAEDMADYTTSNALGVAFGNFMLGYLIVDRIGTRVIRDPFSNKPYIGFYTTKRLGGAVVNFETIKFIKFGSS